MLQIYVFIFGFIKPREHQHSCAIASSPPCQHFLGLSGFSVHFLLLSISSEMEICARERSIWVIALSSSLLFSTEHKTKKKPAKESWNVQNEFLFSLFYLVADFLLESRGFHKCSFYIWGDSFLFFGCAMILKERVLHFFLAFVVGHCSKCF